MLTKDQIHVAAGALLVLEQEGATFAPSSVPSRGLSASEAAQYLVEIDAHLDSMTVEFREEAVCFSVEFMNTMFATCPAECIAVAMQVRGALSNMSSN